MVMLWMGTDLLPFQTVSVDVLTPVQPYQSPLGPRAGRGGAAATARKAMRQSTILFDK